MSATAGAQPGSGPDSLVFNTFSIAAIDPRTGEAGVAVTTRVACVGNGVPWVRAGIGAVATQSNTRTEYGNELLDAIAGGESPAVALRRLTAADSGRDGRQIGVIAGDGRSAQFTGSRAQPWAGHLAGPNYVTQGNLLVDSAVLAAVARTFEASESSPRHLSDRLVEALAAGHARGGDARKGRAQSAAVIVADPRPGRSRRADGQTVSINVCEHPDPVGELRRVHDNISQTLGFRELQAFAGNDVWQLKVMLHALGLYRPKEPELQRGADALLYGSDVVAAVDSFRATVRLSTPASGSPSGLVDRQTVEALWSALERAGKARRVRELLLETTAIRR
ncbi:MAG: DUF1028 domain-containing protein [Gemmatimonadota bacterium]